MEESIKSLVGIRNKFWVLFHSDKNSKTRKGWHVVVFEKVKAREV